LDSMSPHPDNDTSVADAMRLWHDMRVCINYPSSVHLKEPKAIYDTTMEILEQGGHTGRLQIQISENMPPDAWRRSYPQIVKAINDYGPIKKEN
jgi:EAL domain-containing protein (putative c-di-GMP-specific phosphodiesterase class I)